MLKSTSIKTSEEMKTKPKKLESLHKPKTASKKRVAPKKSTKSRVFHKRKRLNRSVLRRRVRKEFKNKSKFHRGVIYLGHVPHGFYEEEMRQFFSQFGKVTNINIPRSNVSRLHECLTSFECSLFQ